MEAGTAVSCKSCLIGEQNVIRERNRGLVAYFLRSHGLNASLPGQSAGVTLWTQWDGMDEQTDEWMHKRWALWALALQPSIIYCAWWYGWSSCSCNICTSLFSEAFSEAAILLCISSGFSSTWHNTLSSKSCVFTDRSLLWPILFNTNNLMLTRCWWILLNMLLCGILWLRNHSR
jgi:hypothetical protein